MNKQIFEIQPKTVLSQEIYNALRNAILDGRLEPGARLVESKIAQQMGVSRAPLREAIRQLEKDGLVASKIHKETRVVTFSLNEIKELHLLRTVLETLAFQYASTNIKADELAEVELLVERIEEAAASNDAEELALVDYAFHERLCQASGWPRLFRIWKEQHLLLRMWFNVVAQSHGSFMRATAKDHRVMFEAIATRNHTKIAQEVFHHIYFSGPAFREERKRWAEEAGAQFQLLFAGWLVKDPDTNK